MMLSLDVGEVCEKSAAFGMCRIFFNAGAGSEGGGADVLEEADNLEETDSEG
jgi:hypothetical protein